ncbi:MAG: PepSY domain-containing protein [Rhodospirillales bacterium]|nr:PepSY domain-containing protein [Rhodospirillales bacterium]
MSRERIIPIVVAAAMAATFAYGTAHADQYRNQSDVAALVNAKVSLSQAIAIAEKQVQGKAVSAGVDDQNGVIHISVDVATGPGVQTVLVDPQTGQASLGRADTADSEHRNQHED